MNEGDVRDHVVVVGMSDRCESLMVWVNCSLDEEGERALPICDS